jgi:hypothetical protein
LGWVVVEARVKVGDQGLLTGDDVDHEVGAAKVLVQRRLLRRKNDKTPVIAALVPEGAPVLAADEIELVPGPGFPRSSHT